MWLLASCIELLSIHTLSPRCPGYPPIIQDEEEGNGGSSGSGSGSGNGSGKKYPSKKYPTKKYPTKKYPTKKYGKKGGNGEDSEVRGTCWKNLTGLGMC